MMKLLCSFATQKSSRHRVFLHGVTLDICIYAALCAFHTSDNCIFTISAYRNWMTTFSGRLLWRCSTCASAVIIRLETELNQCFRSTTGTTPMIPLITRPKNRSGNYKSGYVFISHFSLIYVSISDYIYELIKQNYLKLTRSSLTIL